MPLITSLLPAPSPLTLLAFLSPLPSFPLRRAGLRESRAVLCLCSSALPWCLERRRHLVRAQAGREVVASWLSFMALSKVRHAAVQAPLSGGPPLGQLDTAAPAGGLCRAGAHVLVEGVPVHQQAVF